MSRINFFLDSSPLFKMKYPKYSFFILFSIFLLLLFEFVSYSKFTNPSVKSISDSFLSNSSDARINVSNGDAFKSLPIVSTGDYITKEKNVSDDNVIEMKNLKKELLHDESNSIVLKKEKNDTLKGDLIYKKTSSVIPMKETNDSLKEGFVNYFNPRQFYPNASEGFVQYSAYRFSPYQIAIIGLGPTSVRRRHAIGPCVWYGNDGDKIYGKFNYTFNGEMQKTDDEELFICNLDKATGDGGGYLVGDLNKEKRIMFEEEEGMLQSANEPFRINHTYCGAPFHGRINGRAVYEWMEYHRVIMGINNFIFYCVNAMDQMFYDLMNPYLEEKILKMVDLKELLKFDVWYFGQVMANLDCMYQVALESRWVFLHDIDEYLYPVPPHTLSSLLAIHKEKVWMTHGMVEFNINYCNNRSGDDLFAIERMVFREPRVYCVKKWFANRNLCLSWPGHRKLIVNPRKTFFAQVHLVPYPKENGIDFNASSELRHYHFRRIITQPTSSYCVKIFPEKMRWWITDYTLASTVKKIRSTPIGVHNPPI